MLNTPSAFGGMVTAPHHLAAQTGAAILREGGNAVEAMIGMAATVAVAYPHMNALGGDGFWLIAAPGRAPIGIQACGPAAEAATCEHYAERGHAHLPTRGGAAALTVAGTVAGWDQAERLAAELGGRIPRRDLLSDAIRLAEDGVAVTEGQARLSTEKLGELKDVPGFAGLFLPEERPPVPGHRMRQPALAGTLRRLAEAGLQDFYRGDIARTLANDLEKAGSPVGLRDLEACGAARVEPLSVALSGCRLFNMPPPTQGVSSLAILAIFERLRLDATDDFGLVHGLVEATKQAFLVRNARVFDPAYMDCDPRDLLAPDVLDRMAAAVDARRAAPWPHEAAEGDTVWMGAIDRDGVAVSFIQSIYWEFGSGVVSPATGVLWQNRGISFSLEPGHANRLAPGRLPFHTLNPALALFDDGRRLVYGTMGGEGQPQTQAAVFARYRSAGMALQAAVSAPRWLLGRTWGSESTNLKLEGRFPPELAERLRSAGHDIETVAPFTDMMGHAGAVLRHGDGRLEGASDPRSDGAVAAL